MMLTDGEIKVGLERHYFGIFLFKNIRLPYFYFENINVETKLSANQRFVVNLCSLYWNHLHLDKNEKQKKF